jgi:hypothetical protein
MKRKTFFVVMSISLMMALLSACGGGGSDGSSASSSDTGTAGSMSRFAIVDDHLYTIADDRLQIFDISTPSSPEPWAQFWVGFNIETLFSYQSHLYIGANDGVYIYENSNPEFPEFVSLFRHFRGCDPVVVQGNYAYVTLRGSGACPGAVNQLDIIDISIPSQPTLVKSYPMQGPQGLGIDGNLLFVCDGIAGLKVFDAVNPMQIQSLQTVADLDCYDVIPLQENLVVSDELGILQYNYAALPMQLQSDIPVDTP